MGLQYDDKNVVVKDGEYSFQAGYAHFGSDNLRISDHPITGLPVRNFKISFEFKTSELFTPLFSMDAINGRGGHDRHVYLVMGFMMVRVWPAGKF